MIICDQHRFAFVHVPKCGGESARRILSPFDSTSGGFSKGVAFHPELGRIDYNHIPLRVLLRYFADEYQRVADYRAFAVCRSPFERFPSSLRQRLFMYKGLAMHRLSIQQIYREIDEVIRYLTRESTILNPEFIHFERQVSYIYADEKRIVDSIYPLENLKGMFKEIGYILGQNFAVPPRENQSVAYRSRFIGLMAEQSKRRLLSMGGRSLPDPIRKIARRFVYVPPRRHFSEIMNSVTIRDFVTSYYARDLVLYENIRAGS